MNRFQIFLSFTFTLFFIFSPPIQPAYADSFIEVELPGVTRVAIGLTATQTSVFALLGDDAADLRTSKTRVLIVAGLGGRSDAVDAALDCAEWFFMAEAASAFRERFTLSLVPCARPDVLDSKNDATVRVDAVTFPPIGDAYGGVAHPEAAYLWRWIGMHAPDIVVELRTGKTPAVFIPPSDDAQLRRLGRASPVFSGASAALVAQLVRLAPSGVGTIPALRLETPPTESARVFGVLLDELRKADFRGPSPSRSTLQKRLDRSAREIASQLSSHYGHELKSVAYIPAVALIGRLRLGESLRSTEHLRDVERIVMPYVSGAKPSLPAKPSGSNLSGHLIFAELARVTANKRYVELTLEAADLGFDAGGKPRGSMPFHNEMSDSVFMGCPILAAAGKLTGETKYYDMCLTHMRFMLDLNLRGDGLHRHSPLDRAAWGRGNGFPALGLALSLSVIPATHPGRDEMLTAFAAHIRSLVNHQDPTGAWHQVVDVPGSYRELSSTCMITFAIVRGVRSGWLNRAVYTPVIEKAWRAIRMRVAADGGLVDVCTGTGKQKDLQAYFDRRAILGPDPRGGAMALLVSTEMAVWERENARK